MSEIHLLNERLRELFQLPRGSGQMRIWRRCLHSAHTARAFGRRLRFWAWSPQMGRRTIKSVMAPPPVATKIGGPCWIKAPPRSVPVLLTAMAVEQKERRRPIPPQRRSCTNQSIRLNGGSFRSKIIPRSFVGWKKAHRLSDFG
jgi:hypothetical protein